MENMLPLVLSGIGGFAVGIAAMVILGALGMNRAKNQAKIPSSVEVLCNFRHV